MKAKELLKVKYNPDRIVQYYYKAINNARLLLTALKETVTDNKVKRNAYSTFEKHIDLKETCQEWNRSAVISWAEMKKNFSKEIQINLTNQAIIQQKEQSNAILDQTKEQEEMQQHHMEMVVLQTQKIQELEIKFVQQLANIATSSGGSIPVQIPVTIDTSTSGSRSITSTVTKEQVI